MKIAVLVLVFAVALVAVLRLRPPAGAAAFVPVTSPSFVPADAHSPSPSAPFVGRRVAGDGASRAPIVVDVAGAVVHPGLQTIAPGARVDAAVKLAVPSASADMNAVNLAAHAIDGEEIVVPRAGEGVRTAAVAFAGDAGVEAAASEAPAKSRRKHRRHARKNAVAAAPASPVDINHASSDELATVPGIGARLAERIVAFREANGPFVRVDDLADVAGISERALDEMSPYLRSEP